ncbi:MAG: RES family NAD+ phosphorylase [Trebonia sp.]
MPLAEPPVHFDGQPNRFLLRRGTCLWRVSRRSYGARSFKPTLAGVPAGARFDGSADDPYPYYYTALDETTAVAETLLRNLVPNEQGNRLVPLAALAGRQLSGLTLTRELNLVSLITGEDLGAVGQDAWLVTAHGAEYEYTRKWGHWLRRQATWAHGFVWESLRNHGGLAVVLFGDRCAADFGPAYERVLLHEVTELTVDLHGKDGTAWLREILKNYRVTIP